MVSGEIYDCSMLNDNQYQDTLQIFGGTEVYVYVSAPGLSLSAQVDIKPEKK